MRSKSVAHLLVDLEVARTHSRPHVSDDNPYSEAQFKTLKYRPDFPERFGSIEHARAHCQRFFPWYSTEHRHSGIGFMTPEAVHYGRASEIHHLRAAALDAAFLRNPLRFKGVPPQPQVLPTAAWINPPKKEPASTTATDACAVTSRNSVSQCHRHVPHFGRGDRIVRHPPPVTISFRRRFRLCTTRLARRQIRLRGPSSRTVQPQPVAAPTAIFAILPRHSRGPVSCTDVPFASTATVTGMSFTSNS